MNNPIISADKTPWYQWDTGLTVTVAAAKMDECHFANRKQGTAYVQAVINGVARVPDELLQVAAPIKAYGYVSDGAGGQTYIEETFEVIARNIPADYTYTKTAQKTIRDAEAARDEAVQAAKDAKASELAAADSAVEASTSAQSAGESASAASTSASNAANSAGEAAKSASDAKAAASKTVEDASELLKTYTDNAKTSADNAATSASNAADAASAASGSASAAEQSATDASNAKVAAQTAKAEAATSASNAATSASNAESSATAAAKSASDAAASVGAINVIAPKTVGVAASSEVDGSVAVGAGSVAKNANELSIGNETLTREITHVSEPTAPTSTATKKYTDDNDAKTLTEAKQYTDANTSNALVGTVSGKLLHVEDAWPSPVRELVVHGKSKQATTIGKNLLNGCDSYFKNGDAGMKNYLWGYSLGSNPIVLDKPLEPGEYIFSVYSDSVCYIYFSKNPYVIGEYASFAANKVINDDTRFGLKRYYSKFTLHNTYELMGIYSEHYLACFGGMIEKGTTVTAYEPYTGGKPSPSPEYSQEIVSIVDATVTSTGRCIVDPVYINESSPHNATMFAEGALDKFAGKTIYVSLVADKGYNAYFNENIAKQYTALTATGSRQTFAIMLVDEMDSSNSRQYNKELGWVILKNGDSNATAPNFRDVCIEVADSGEYHTYVGSTTPNLLVSDDGTAYELRSLPDGTRDELVVKDGRKVLVKRVGYIEDVSSLEFNTDGTSNVNPRVSFKIGTNARLSKGEDRENLMSRGYVGRFSNESGSVYIVDSADNDMIVFANSSFSSKDVALELLSGIDVYFPLATTETIDLGPADPIALPETVSNVWVNDNLTPEMSMTYKRDVNVFIAGLTAQIAALKGTTDPVHDDSTASPDDAIDVPDNSETLDVAGTVGDV